MAAGCPAANPVLGPLGPQQLPPRAPAPLPRALRRPSAAIKPQITMHPATLVLARLRLQVMMHDAAVAEGVAREISLVMSFRHPNIIQASGCVYMYVYVCI